MIDVSALGPVLAPGVERADLLSRPIEIARLRGDDENGVEALDRHEAERVGGAFDAARGARDDRLHLVDDVLGRAGAQRHDREGHARQPIDVEAACQLGERVHVAASAGQNDDVVRGVDLNRRAGRNEWFE